MVSNGTLNNYYALCCFGDGWTPQGSSAESQQTTKNAKSDNLLSHFGPWNKRLDSIFPMKYVTYATPPKSFCQPLGHWLKNGSADETVSQVAILLLGSTTSTPVLAHWCIAFTSGERGACLGSHRFFLGAAEKCKKDNVFHTPNMNNKTLKPIRI